MNEFGKIFVGKIAFSHGCSHKRRGHGIDADAERRRFQGQRFAQAFHRVLRVARTIADLEGSAGIGSTQVAEALGYRPRSEDALVPRAPERCEALESAASS